MLYRAEVLGFCMNSVVCHWRDIQIISRFDGNYSASVFSANVDFLQCSLIHFFGSFDLNQIIVWRQFDRINDIV